jgi:hypothetical protein
VKVTRIRLVAALFLAVAVSAVLAACSPGPAAELQVALSHPGTEAYTLIVDDESGLLTGATSRDRLAGDPTDSVLAFPDRNELELYWLGGACSHKPTLKITGDASALLLEVSNPQDPQWLPFLTGPCPAVGVPLLVVLSLSEPVAVDHVSVVENY